MFCAIFNFQTHRRAQAGFRHINAITVYNLNNGKVSLNRMLDIYPP